MRYRRLPIEIESPEERGYDTIRCNLTESSFTDGTLAEFGVELSGELTVAYGDHRGLPELRELIAEHSNPGGRTTLGADDVLCTPGAAAALFFVATSLLEDGDHLLVEHTNYATNLETPRVIGAEVETLELRMEEGFALDVDRVATSVRPSTRLISVTSPHNPTGTVLSRSDLDALVELAERHELWLLVDETYRDMDPDPLPVAATLSSRAISVSSLSKSYGLPGLRLGWVLTQDPETQERLLAAKEQVVICGSALDEEAACQVLRRRDEHLARILPVIAERRGVLLDWLVDQDWLDVVEPRAGVVCFPRLRPGAVDDVDGFYRAINDDGTFVGEGHWFDADRRHFRLGFGWPGTDELLAGLSSLTAGAASVR
ncbi:pyridoxal phosphate-dependent aminotransferase [Dermatobacter hominis]|uniref:pyridoxal phosphate-dependent aminotransferase n=1 Tax=Dermatobacter hominis TaxID=2884263 RepID=UPI001D0F4DD2|nr:pyridoxal phosphate-dependent aminotransferase [Dermatobacter hominis]UDY34671.1 pyridoxal phosphate-dependent aminotransferase [Dermatobacter hominis]